MTTEPVHLRLVEVAPAHLRLVDGVPAGTAAELVDTYSRQVDELAAMVEAEAARAACTSRTLADSLGELHGALDELQTRLRREAARVPAASRGFLQVPIVDEGK